LFVVPHGLNIAKLKCFFLNHWADFTYRIKGHPPIFIFAGIVQTGTSLQQVVCSQMKVAEIVRKLLMDGWYLHASRGSHHQYKHPEKKGRVTVPGKPSNDLAPGTLNSICKQAGWK